MFPHFCYNYPIRTGVIKFCILASSSAGNAAFVATDRTRLLIDAGLSRREVARRLAAIGEDIDSLDAVLVTHEHSDHTCGLNALSKAAPRPLPLYLTHGTAGFIDWDGCAPVLEKFQAGCKFTIGDFDIASFTIPHDAMDPVGFTLTSQGVKIAIATDLGYITQNIPDNLRDATVVLLESNHDLEMLRVGPYPWSVKQRVMSRRGHLSNEVAGQFIKDHLGYVHTLILGHLSEHNNHPELVRSMGLKALNGRTLFTNLVVAAPGVRSGVFCY
jgi:phosphoribosyl 1,2-cyclic phosphodiesterase